MEDALRGMRGKSVSLNRGLIIPATFVTGGGGGLKAADKEGPGPGLASTGGVTGPTL